MVAFTQSPDRERPLMKGGPGGTRAGGKCQVNCLYSLRGFCLPLSKHGRCRCSPAVCRLTTLRPSPTAMTKGPNMPSFEHHGATIYYEEFGQGFPILTFAPAGLQSVIDVWNRPSAPVNPTTAFAANFRVIAMDQRNAGGQSHAPITAQDGWHTYAADHIALLDHLRIDRCHLYGQGIGGSFILSPLNAQPQRTSSAGLAQPIGRVGATAPGRPARFGQ